MHSTDYRLRLKDSVVGLQFLFVAFWCVSSCSILTGLDPNVALFTAVSERLYFSW